MVTVQLGLILLISNRTKNETDYSQLQWQKPLNIDRVEVLSPFEKLSSNPFPNGPETCSLLRADHQPENKGDGTWVDWHILALFDVSFKKRSINKDFLPVP